MSFAMARPRVQTKNMRLFLYLCICQLIGLAGGWATQRHLRDWYPTLKKPWFNPPNWLFAPVWTVLYILMAIAGSRIGHDPHCFQLFALQLVLNCLWSFCFFAWRNPALALADILLLWITIAACVQEFGRIDPTAAWLMWPYWLWVSFATLLNFELWRLNRR